MAKKALLKNKTRGGTRRRGKESTNKGICEKGKENVWLTLMLCLNIKQSTNLRSALEEEVFDSHAGYVKIG